MCGLHWDGEKIKEKCAKGEHCWDIECLGGGAASFACMHCPATSHGSLEPLKQHGFAPVQTPSGEEVWVNKPKENS